MGRYVWLFICLWIMAWLPLGWLLWLPLVTGVLVIAGWYSSASVKPIKRLSLINMACLVCLGVALKTYAMAQQQRQLPVYLQDQVLLVSACYVHKGEQDFPLSIGLKQMVLWVPGVDQQDGPVQQWYEHLVDRDLSLQLSVYQRAAIEQLQQHTGGQISALIKLRKPRNFANQHGFDYVAWSQRQGHLARGYVKQLLAVTHQPGAPQCGLLGGQLDNLRAGLRQQLQAFALSEVAHKLWLALAIGDTQALDGGDWQLVNSTGTTHLLIVSGLHIGLLASFVLLLWRCIQPYTGVNYWHPIPLLLAWLVALAYALISGWGLPAQRAMIMVSFVLLGGWRRIVWPLEQRLLAAAVVTLVWQPHSLYESGFWFSYLAVANLALVWRPSQRPDRLGFAHWWHINWLSQVALLALLVPIIGALTGGVSLLAPWLNLILIPLFTLCLVPGTLLLSVLMQIWDLPPSWISLWGGVFDYLWHCLQQVAQMPGAYQRLDHWPWSLWGVWLLLGLGCLVLGRWAWLGVIAGLLMLAGVPDKAVFRLRILDVGQGLGVWVQHREHNLLYDLGDRYRSGFSLMEGVILPNLRHAGVDHLARVYISHWDRDHSGGMDALRGQGDMRVQTWVLPSGPLPKSVQPLDATRQSWRHCQQQAWQTIGAFKVRQFAPVGRGFQDNNASCIVQIEYAGRRILLPGDIEIVAEQKLWREYGSELASDILIAPHHGSQTSSSAAFLDYVQPRVSLISAGFDNRFGHPHRQVLARYWAKDVYWLNTATHGQIDVLLEATNWQIISQRYD